MRLGLLVSSLSRQAGGVFEAVRRLGQCLQGQGGVQVEALGLRDNQTETDAAQWFPLKPRSFACRGPASFGYAPPLAAELQELSLDLVHLHGLWMYPSVAARGWSRRTGRPHVVTPHGMLEPWALANSRWKKRLAGWFFENANLRTAACIHALCEAEAQSIRAYGLKNPICIIPNGIDLPDLSGTQGAENKRQIPERLAGDGMTLAEWRTDGRKILLYLGRLHPKKGLVNLLRAWRMIQVAEGKAESGWVLGIAGWDQGGHEGELKRLATELKIPWVDVRAHKSPVCGESSVFFLGPQFGEAKAACYRSCDGFILPSFSEGLPMVVLEAWANGKPVLMTAECNLPDGFAASAALRIETNAESVAEGIRDLFQAPSSKLHAMGERGRQLVTDKFTWPKIAADMKSVYEWAAGGGSMPSSILQIR